MRKITFAAVAGLMVFAGSSFAADLQRVRGTIESADDGTVTVKTNDGGQQKVSVGDAKFVWVVKSSLDQIKDGVFIGTATKGENPLTALEVVLFPDSMRGTGEGHYAWDAIADRTATGGGTVKSSMTNGTVQSTTSAPKVKSSMTNGTVKSSTGEGGERTLTVTYDKEGSKTIVVPPSAPIVAFEPADKGILKSDGHVFIVANKDGDTLKARLVAVGKDGVVPPM